jgi:UTP--glucose-1-phosphate uridylyltransferase
VLQPGIFDVLAKQGRGAGGEIQLTDAIGAMLPEVPVFGQELDCRRFDCGSRVGFVEANLAFALAEPELEPRVREMIRRYGV